MVKDPLLPSRRIVSARPHLSTWPWMRRDVRVKGHLEGTTLRTSLDPELVRGYGAFAVGPVMERAASLPPDNAAGVCGAADNRVRTVTFALADHRCARTRPQVVDLLAGGRRSPWPGP